MAHWEERFKMCTYCGMTYDITKEHNGAENDLTEHYCSKCIAKAREDKINWNRED